MLLLTLWTGVPCAARVPRPPFADVSAVKWIVIDKGFLSCIIRIVTFSTGSGLIEKRERRGAGSSTENRVKLVLFLKQDIASFCLGRPADRPGDHPEHAGEEDPPTVAGFDHVDGRGDRPAHGRDVEVELVAGPAGTGPPAPRWMCSWSCGTLLAHPPARLVLAEIVGESNVHGRRHGQRQWPAFQRLPSRWWRTMGEVMRKPSGTRTPFSWSGCCVEYASPAAAAGPQPRPLTPAARLHHRRPGTSRATARCSLPLHGARGRSAFNDYLATAEVGRVRPTWQPPRTATRGRTAAAEPVEVPPTTEWPHMVQTLRYVDDYVVPAVGPVEPCPSTGIRS